MLLEHGAEVNAPDQVMRGWGHGRAWMYADHQACVCTRACACVHAHGDAAADVNVVDGQRGETPAHLAAKGGHGEALKLVVAAGADVNGKDKVSRSAS